ncbi:hypothetical protein BDP27DRAFT_736980 [Rhodocollybia butyracea]|uniref:Uncharacterized protein n=1 Tax=Rhodocollybia butyracea TaxID=206335 RepID=A0A9P5PNK7_9AGAR|nr:hypothetical protein BDP27DRAFT_736980 [Rhodocollybia butyracea]
MYTSYGKFIRTDPSVISRALAISLELGVLLTIVSADDTANSHSASNKLAKSVLTHRRRAVAPEYTQRWAKWLMAGPEYACGLYFMYPDEGDVPITEDSILYVGVTNHGTADIVYAYPNYA